MSEGASWRAGFKADYDSILVEPWAPHIGAILMVLIILLLMVNGLFWGVFGGLKLWGDWFNRAIGLGGLLNIKSELDGPLMHRMSLMNITLIGGSFAAALIARQFSIFRAPKLEYLWGAMGGTLMGIGATLAGGCTTGGFFTPALHSSPAGWMMAVGLITGAIIGLKLLMWTLENISWGMQAPGAHRAAGTRDPSVDRRRADRRRRRAGPSPGPPAATRCWPVAPSSSSAASSWASSCTARACASPAASASPS